MTGGEAALHFYTPIYLSEIISHWIYSLLRKYEMRTGDSSSAKVERIIVVSPLSITLHDNF